MRVWVIAAVTSAVNIMSVDNRLVERRVRHGIRMTHTKTLVAGIPNLSLAQPRRIWQWGPVGASACAVAYVRRTRDDREMYITVVSSATWNRHTRAYMHSSQISEIQHVWSKASSSIGSSTISSCGSMSSVMVTGL